MSFWISSNLDDIILGEYIRGSTSTNSQKHGDDYNYSVEGFLVYKDDIELHKCKILTEEGEIRNLCTWVGTSGYNDVCKKNTL